MKAERIKEIRDAWDSHQLITGIWVGDVDLVRSSYELLDEVERQAKEIARLAQNTCVCNGALSNCDGMAYCRISVSLTESETEVARLKRELENL